MSTKAPHLHDLPDPGAMLALLAKHPEEAAELMARLANSESPKAVEAAGLTPDRLRALALAALEAGEASAAASLAGAFSCGSAAQAAAVASAYELRMAQRAGSFERFDPDDCSPCEWRDMVELHPANAAMWARSPALKLESREFWRHLLATKADWEDPASRASLAERFALREMAENLERGDKVASLGPNAFAAVVAGLADLRAWESIHGLLEDMADAHETANDSGKILLAERARAVAAGCADLARAARSSDWLLSCVSTLCLIDPKAARALAQAGRAALIDVKDLGWVLEQPSFSDSAADHAALMWGGASRSSRDMQALMAAFPSVELTLAELVSRWDSPEGKQLAQAIGASPTARSTAVFSALERLGAFEPGSAEAAALLDKLALAGSTPEARPAAPARARRV